MADVLVSVRIPVEMNDRIVALAGSRGRSGFIKKAIEAGLRGQRMVPADRTETGEKVRVPKKNSTVGVSGDVVKSKSASKRLSLSPDGDQLMSYLLARPRSERDIAKDLDWMPGRVAKAVRELDAAGSVLFQNGLIEVHLG